MFFGEIIITDPFADYFSYHKDQHALDYSKIEANQITLEKHPFAMADVLNSVLSDLHHIAQEKGISLQQEIGKGFIDGWLGDIVRVKQILLNLTSNAVKFTQQGSVTIKVNKVPQSNGNTLRIDVIDTGIGMSREEQRRVFDRFAQADTSTTRKFGGTGLGLSISQSLINLMNGKMAISSEPGKGTRVVVTLPLQQAELSSESSQQVSSGPPMLSGKNILIAEDNEINQFIIESMLQPTEATLDFANNGKLAIDAFKRKPYDIVLMDIQMPEMDGLEAYSIIKELNQTAPVIALTANVMADDVQKYSQAGFTGHIGKPIDANELYTLLHELLKADII
ncbi:MAG: ATP-binding protein [Aestuariibacter sp.]